MCSSVEAFLCFGCMFWITSVKIGFLERLHLTHENNISSRKQNHPVILELLKDFCFGGWEISFLIVLSSAVYQNRGFWTTLNKRRVLSCYFFLQWLKNMSCHMLISNRQSVHFNGKVGFNVFSVLILFSWAQHGTPKYMIP